MPAIYYSGLREYDLVAYNLGLGIFAMFTVLKLPQLNNPIVCREHLYAIVVRMTQEFKRVNLLIKFKTFQVIEFWLV